MNEPRFLIDPYKDWVAKEGIPVHEGFGLDLLDLDVAPWPRLEANGAFAHLTGRGDFIDMQIVEIPPGGKTAPQRHLYEEVVYVLAGRGSTSVESPSGERHSFEWHTGSLFAIPLNGSYRHYNGSGTEPARIVAVTDLPLILNVFRDEAFIWDNPRAFPDRFGDSQRFRGDGTFLPVRPGRHMWETNFVPDLRTFELKEWKARGAGGSNIMFVLADGTMHAHMSEMPVGTYKKGHRHGADFHVFAVTGEGYSLYWWEGETELRRFDWKHGCVFAPADRLFHQHFNVSAEPARYLAIAFGGLRYPTLADKRATFMGMDVSVKEGGRQIEYEDEDPRIRRIYEDELRKRGIPSRMDAVFQPA
ncbi:MAG: cupin domain-containing protein [Chloroflexi bacterium]|nr:MAG: cupin domain-containing protein [Chloroflexota bacterium]TMG54009.1 MAG: cupin domain-containing protein [Chloroflexota bacterium]